MPHAEHEKAIDVEYIPHQAGPQPKGVWQNLAWMIFPWWLRPKWLDGILYVGDVLKCSDPTIQSDGTIRYEAGRITIKKIEYIPELNEYAVLLKRIHPVARTQWWESAHMIRERCTR